MAQDSTSGARRMRCPEEVLASIPWYVDGGLTARERGAVEAHAALCADCRAELDIVAGRPWALDDVALPDAERVFREIGARIEAARAGEPANVIPISRGRVLSGEDLERIEHWVLDPSSEVELEASGAREEREDERAREGVPRGGVRRLPGGLAPLVAAAAAIVLFVAGGVVGRLGLPSEAGSAVADLDADANADVDGEAGADYQLASAASASASVDAAPKLDVVFADAATARDISSALRGLGVEIVAGPTNLGVYRLRVLPSAVEGRAPTAADAAAIAARLAGEEGAVALFAEPVP